MKTPVRILVNFVIVAVIVNVFVNVGWLQHEAIPQIFANEFFNTLAINGIIGSAMIIVGTFAEFIYKVFKIATLGLGNLAYPIFFVAIGFTKIYVPLFLLAGWFSLSANFVQILIMSVVVGLFRVPAKK